MKITRIHLLSRFVFIFWLAASVRVMAQSARIAIVGDPSLGALIDVTTAELSKQPNLSVLDRADLNKLGQEQALKTAIESNDFYPIRLLSADGLVIFRAVKVDGKMGVFARLVAIQPGVILREVALPDGDDPLAKAQALSKEFSPYWMKLAAIQKGKITALSLLGQRFEVDAPENREMERRINVLLASRLSAEPDTLVLERWRLNDAIFEKSLSAREPTPFWTGSSLIDGSIKRKQNEVEVTLRVRPPQGPEVSILDKDTVDNLPALAGRLADKIQKHPISQDVWNPSAEAGHYAELGKWCLDNRLYDEGAEAIESALALGDMSRTTHMLQIRAYALLAYPDELQDFNSSYGTGLGFGLITRDSLPGRLQSGTLAADLTCEYLRANHDFSDQSSSVEDLTELSLSVLYNCLRSLRLAYDNGFQQGHGDEAAILRHEVQKLIAQMEPFIAEKPSGKQACFLDYKVGYAAFWNETPEKTLVFYRELLNSKTNGEIIRKKMFVPGYPVLHPPYLDADHDLAGAPVWYVEPPWIIASDDRSPDEIKTLWKNFLKELAASPDPILQADALKFEFSSIETDQSRDDAGARVVAFLQQHSEGISGPRCNDFMTGFSPAFIWVVQTKNTTYLDQLRELNKTLLKQRVVLATAWIDEMHMLLYDKNKPPDSQPLPDYFDDYCKWYQTQADQDDEVAKALDRTRKFFSNTKVEEATTKMKNDFVSVHQYWPPVIVQTAQMGCPGWIEPTFVDSSTLMTMDNKVWCLAFSAFTPMSHTRQILCIDPASLQTISSYSIPDQYNPEGQPAAVTFDVTPQWLAVMVNGGHVLLCSRVSNQWRELDVPLANYQPRWINQELYLIYEVEAGFRSVRMNGSGAASAISGLIHVLLPEGKIENVISTRRIPPQSALDGKPLGYPLDLWNSPAGLMLAVDADSPHFQVFASPLGKNDWALVATDPSWCDVKIGAGGALIGKDCEGHDFTQIVLMNGATTQLLLSNPGRDKANGSQKPVWEIPEEIRTAPPEEIRQVSPVMRGEDLCLYRNVLNPTGPGQACLYYFTKGQKSGLKIPLTFDTQGIKDLAMSRSRSTIFDYQSLQTTDYGLIIGLARNEFCVIPWSDIDAYRAQFISGAAPATAPTDASPQTSPPAPVVPSASVAPPASVAPSSSP